LNIGTHGPAAAEQARRIRVFCAAFGVPVGPGIVAAISSAVAANIERLRQGDRLADVEWWQAQLDWIEQNGAMLAAAGI
jgi:hypothetical protein